MQNNTASSNSMRVMIMAGGTGGHVFPALAVAKILQQQQVCISWLGTRKGIESELIPQQGIELHYLNVEGLRGRGLLAGTTNKLSAKIATRVMQGFPNTFNHGEHCGNPVRGEIAAIKPPVERFANRQGAMRLLVLGGSRGALAINQLIPEALAKINPQQRPEILHQVGSQHLEKTQALYQAQSLDTDSDTIQIMPFIDSMEEAYQWADFAICRSGALTVAELNAVGLGALLIPFPYAIDDHQTTNGQWLVNAKAALMIQQRDITAQKLADHIISLGNNPDQRLAMANNARSLAKNDAAKRVSEVCMEVANV